jgi:branched-chain amino acid transport system substrate-binding protein
MTILAGCSDKIGEEPPKTQAPLVSPKLQLSKPLPKKKERIQKIALLLPLSGKDAALGQVMQKAAELSLFENADDQLELVIKDTQSTVQGALAAVQSVLKQKVKLILGPIFVSEVQKVSPEAQGHKVPLLSFSSDLNAGGTDRYIMGFLPRDQVKRIITFAHSQGIDRLLALIPSSPYGALVNAELKALSSAGISPSITTLTYTGAGERLEEEIKKLNSLSYNGLFLPVGKEELKLLLSNMQAFGFDFTKVKLLGTGLWDSPEVQEIPVLREAWYASVDPSQRASFERRFQEYYGVLPVRIATLAYDGVAVAAELVKAYPTHPFERKLLTRSKGFKGIDGWFRLTSQGITERTLAILEISPEGVRVINQTDNHF